jgi:hypothetical protein
MGQFLIPANSKRSMLIFGVFRPIDFVIVLVGMGVSLLAFLVIDTSNSILVTLALIPGLFSGFLVFPIPNYHNTLTIIMSSISFFTNRRDYVWKGWCFSDGKDQ